jgi:hypothetical protein
MRDETNYIPLYMRPSSDLKPLKAEVTPNRKELFAALNEFVTKRGAFLTSIPGEKEVRMECVPDSTVPDELRKLGYTVEPDGEGERILPHAITTQVVSGVDGVLTPLTEGSSGRPVISIMHAGICRVLKFTFTLP